MFPARKLPKIDGWKMKGIFSYLVFFYISIYFPLLYDQWLPDTQLLDLSGMNLGLSAMLGILLYQFCFYIYHIIVHNSNFLWKLFHQMHHSSERLDTFSAFYFSPYEMMGFTLISTFCFSFLLGLSAQAVTVVILVLNFFSIFQHANIKTPVWLGYFIQRPESHAIHHSKGYHANNYSDLPLFDILFRTFKNPKEYIAETGFYEGASSRVKDMLMLRDVSNPSHK